jgi:hypothetical protein
MTARRPAKAKREAMAALLAIDPDSITAANAGELEAQIAALAAKPADSTTSPTGRDTRSNGKTVTAKTAAEKLAETPAETPPAPPKPKPEPTTPSQYRARRAAKGTGLDDAQLIKGSPRARGQAGELRLVGDLGGHHGR